MRAFHHHWRDLLIVVLALAAQVFTVWQLGVRKRLALAALVSGAVLLGAGLLFRSLTISEMFPVQMSDFIRGAGFLTLVVSFGTAVAALAWRCAPRSKPHHSPQRRKFLLATRAVVLASPVVATGYGVFIQRYDFQLREVDVPIRGLNKALDGLRLVQLSDIHLSPFLAERDLARVIDMANETRADLALVTGDLVTSSRDPLDACIRQLSRLRAGAGIIGCLGNHEVYARAEDYTTKEAGRLGIRFLRDRSEVLFFGGQPINFTGVDYQQMNVAYLAGTQRHILEGMPNILLSHNPDVFPTAAKQGFDLTLSGHTHGGQITVELLHQNLSVARFYTPYVYGLYREGDSSIYVTRGVGTVGVPARLGAPPEVALIRLCAT